MQIDGKWVGLGIGDVDPEVGKFKAFLTRKLQWVRDWQPPLDDSDAFDQTLVDVVKELQSRYGLPTTGIVNYALKLKSGYLKPPQPPARPIMFTVEGHLSNPFAGPVADTATQLEAEGHCWHQPIGYNNSPIPFDNDSGVQGLARLVGAAVMDNGRPFPAGTPWSLGTFSQGGIVGFDFYTRYLQPGQPLDWRAKDLVGVLAYGNPCRQQGSVAPWAMPWVKKVDTHGLDPLRRFGVPGLPDRPAHPWVDVWREGDIFAQNGDDNDSEVKAAVYQAVARGDLFSDPYSLAAQVADLFSVGFDEVIGIVMAIVSGVTFLAQHPNPHYDPYDITGGVNWMRDRLTAVASA